MPFPGHQREEGRGVESVLLLAEDDGSQVSPDRGRVEVDRRQRR
jgi:hypothetical protein